jgi:ABC-type multidrug transport system fused ATPase/permease subunit
MAEIIHQKHEIKESVDAVDLVTDKGMIEFRHVSFLFHDKMILNDLQLSIKAGEKVALVGKSGAGKTTITRLLFRQYDPQKGSVLIDGVNIAKVTLESLGNALSMVPQEPMLFNRTLLENIRYGRPDASDEEVYAAAKLAHCHEFIISHPAGYASLVGERGIKLSGGERQRIAIARAFLRNSPIIVLDEATSSLDSESEGYIQDAFEKLMKERTTIVIAHRLSTIRKMDRIIVIDNGIVVEDGSHEELIKQNGTYSRLWNIQQGGFMKDDQTTGEEIAHSV